MWLSTTPIGYEAKVKPLRKVDDGQPRCLYCGNVLTGQQRKYCTPHCNNRYSILQKARK